MARLNHVVEGREDGAWVVLAHSLASNLSILEEHARVLAPRFRVLRLDIRGHGASEAPPGPYAMADLAEDVAALMGSLGIARAHYAGISLGGMIGLTLAIRHAGLVDRLVVADTTPGYPAEAHGGWRDRIKAVQAGGTAAVAEGTLGRWFTAPFREAHPDVVERMRAMISATPTEGFVGCCEAILGYGIHASLGSIRSRTLVLVGSEDQATPPAMARALADGIPGARLETLDGAAHQSGVEQPQAFNRHLEAFLAGPH